MGYDNGRRFSVSMVSFDSSGKRFVVDDKTMSKQDCKQRRHVGNGLLLINTIVV